MPRETSQTTGEADTRIIDTRNKAQTNTRGTNLLISSLTMPQPSHRLAQTQMYRLSQKSLPSTIKI